MQWRFFQTGASPSQNHRCNQDGDGHVGHKKPSVFSKACISWAFLQEVLNRYRDLHLVTVNLIANFFKEGKAEFIPKMVETANELFITQMADFNIQPITEQGVTKYYKNNAFIWRFYLVARKIDRYITERILRKKYEFLLPESETKIFVVSTCWIDADVYPVPNWLPFYQSLLPLFNRNFCFL